MSEHDNPRVDNQRSSSVRAKTHEDDVVGHKPAKAVPPAAKPPQHAIIVNSHDKEHILRTSVHPMITLPPFMHVKVPLETWNLWVQEMGDTDLKNYITDTGRRE